MSNLDTTKVATPPPAQPLSNVAALKPLPLGLVHGGPLTILTKDAALPLHLGNKQAAAALVADFLGIKGPIASDEAAVAVLHAFLQFLLDHRRYVDSATLLWPATLFSGEPRAVRMIWDSLFTETATMVPGAASMGKSYSVGVWMMLDWLRDPEFTNIQVVGPSEGHLERNLFSHLVKLHRGASLPLPGDIRRLEISIDPKKKDSGIFGIVVPIGKKAAGRLQGVKVVPRPKPHPQLGALSRLRVVLEEAENIPVGIWDDITNILSNTNGVERFKVVAPFNPKDPNSQCAIRCEPGDGWGSVDIDTSEIWKSKRGWNVVRLDAYKSENVVQGREIFFGMQTKEGLETLIRNAGGANTPGYYTMARGWYPPQGVDLAVIPQHLMNDIFGEYLFVETPQPIGGLDVALEGGDNAIFVLGRFGVASGWYRFGVHPETGAATKTFIAFKNEAGIPIRREVVQVDQIFPLPKGDTLKLVAETRRICQGAGIRGGQLGVDRTGNGAGVHDLLTSQWPLVGCIGVNPSESATERRIFSEDQKLACDEYHTLLAELWFAMRKYIEFGFLKLHPNVPQDPLLAELTGRRIPQSASQSKKTKVESKKDYKSRGNKSPDRADGLSICLHVARRISSGPPSAVNESVLPMGYDGDGGPNTQQRVGLTDRRERLD